MSLNQLVVFLWIITAWATLALAATEEQEDATLLKLQQFWNDIYNGEGESSWNNNDEESSSMSLLNLEVVSKASIDECYRGLGQEQIYPFDPDTQTCSSGKPKVSEAYVFGMTEANGLIWFGSVANMLCLVLGAVASTSPFDRPLTPGDGDTWACEFGASRYGLNAGSQPRNGDWRPPSIYTYNPQTGVTQKQDLANDPLLQETMGIRSAGTLGEVVLLGGPTVNGVGGPLETAGINVFAFHAKTGAYLGSRQFLEYNNIRKFVVVGGVLYTGVAINKAEFPTGDDTPFGAVLRWTGDVSAPFSFEVVGWVDGEAVELAEHEGRLFITTWPDFGKLYDPEYVYAGLWMSPPLGTDGLTNADADSWTKVWSVDDYETDEIAARLYYGGAIASFQGYLYWGSMHIPTNAGWVHAAVYDHLNSWPLGLPNVLAIVKAIFGSHRALNIFRGKNFGTSSSVEKEVLYGMRWMPTYVDGEWTFPKNKMGRPVYGDAGFFNWFNTYAWTMVVHDDALYVGTNDWSRVYTELLIPWSFQDLTDSFPKFDLPLSTPGADLFVFPSSQEGAIPVFQDGMRNNGSFGVRTMISVNDTLYLGMANAMNLDVDDPKGGWELIRVTTMECRDRVRFTDILKFGACFNAGTCYRSMCPVPLYEKECCTLDFDADGDVDLRDLLAFPVKWFRTIWNLFF